MRILEWEQFLREGFSELNSAGQSAMTVGIFDGVHRGHTALIEKIIGYNNNFLPVVVTFRINPKRIKNSYKGDITSFDQKLDFFKKSGVAVTVIADLSDSFMQMSGAEFMQILQEHGRMGFLAIGSNFRCGYHHDTDALAIKKMNSVKNIPSEIHEMLTDEGKPISSSRIREAIAGGKFKDARAMLGRPYVLDIRPLMNSETKSTDGRRTGNISINATLSGQVIPPSGIYNVFFHKKNSNPEPAVIRISEGFIDVPPDCEFMEFR